MIYEILLSLSLLSSRPEKGVADTVYSPEIDSLKVSLKAEGFDVSGYLKDPRFEVYEVLPLNRKASETDYTDTESSWYMRSRSLDSAQRFSEEEREWLDKANETYGVDGEHLTALLNLESSLGEFTGGWSVFNSLVSQYLQATSDVRREFFYSELKEFLRFAGREGEDVFSYRGSFAGAMGPMQFMPSNVRRFGVDFDGDGFDINDMQDAIGSAANYLSYHGFKDDPERALRAYNPSGNYVRAIRTHADSLKARNGKHGGLTGKGPKPMALPYSPRKPLRKTGKSSR